MAQTLLILSILLQAITVVLALRLIRKTGAKLAWLLISGGFTLMAVRRLLTYLHAVRGDIPIDVDVEVIALFISALFMAGIALIGPLFESMRKTRDSLFESNELLERIFDTTFIMVAYLDTGMNFIRVNRAYAEADGHTPDFFPGKNHFALFPNADNERIFRKVAQTGETHVAIAKPFEYEEHLERGVSYWDWTLHPLKDKQGKVEGLLLILIDVTDRINAMMDLRESERGLAEAQRIAQMGHWSLDLVANKLDWSKEVFRLFEMDPRKFGASYEGFLGAIHPDDRDMVNKAYTDSVRDRTPYDIVHRLLMKDGRVKYVNERCETFYDADGKPLRSVGTVLDITERVKGEENLRMFRALMDQSKDSIFMLDAETGRFVDANEEACRSHGYTKEELLNMTLADISMGVRGTDLKAYMGTFKERTAPEVFEDTGRKKDGTLIPVEVSAHHVQVGQKGFVVAVVRDITERQKAERERVRLSTAIEQGEDMVVITGRDGTIVYVNPAFENKTGWSREEAIGQNPRILKSGKHPESLYADMWTTINAGKTWRGQLVNKKKNGELYEVEIKVSPIVGKDGQIASFVAVANDITQAQSLVRARDYFTTITAHELRTPLTRLNLVRIHLGKMQPPEECRKEMGEYLEQLDHCVTDFDRICSATTIFSDVLLGKGKEYFLPQNLKLLLEYCLEAAAEKIETEHRKVGIVRDMEALAETRRVLGDHTSLQRAFLEILSNAAKFSPDGKAVTLTAGVSGTDAVIHITDEGIGIAPEQMGLLFTPFFALEDPIKHSTGQYKFKGGGLGIGLALAKAIIDYHGGTLELASAGTGKGTTATITLPII